MYDITTIITNNIITDDGSNDATNGEEGPGDMEGTACQTANIHYTLHTPYTLLPNMPVKTMHNTAL